MRNSFRKPGKGAAVPLDSAPPAWPDAMSWFNRDVTPEDTPLANLAVIAGEVEAGTIPLPPRWHFERTGSGTQVWTTPAGRRYECDEQGHLLAELPPR